MKKKLVLALVIAIAIALVGCGNKTIWDTTYTFNKAIIKLQNGEVIEGKVDTWTDFGDGDQIQVTINGVTYLVHSSNITLMSK